MSDLSAHYTAFEGDRMIASGEPDVVAARVVRSLNPQAVRVYDDANGRAVDLDLRGDEEEVRARYAKRTPADETRGRGRPKLGVTAREVTLLPRHWDWLAAQPGGVSVALRKLVEEARKDPAAAARAARDVAYRFLVAQAGDRAGFEEAMRSLYAGDRAGFESHMGSWPADVRDHAVKLAFPQA